MFTFAADNDNQVISMFFLGMECSEVTLGEIAAVDDRFARNLSSILSKNQEKFLALLRNPYVNSKGVIHIKNSRKENKFSPNKQNFFIKKSVRFSESDRN